MDELMAAKMRILQTIRIAKQEDNLLIVELQREALEMIDRQIKKDGPEKTGTANKSLC